MPLICHYCSGPLPGEALRGRPSPKREPACYCCYGCLSLGEEPPANGPHESKNPLGSLGWRLGVGVLLTGQSMLIGLGVNLAPPDEPEAIRVLQGLVIGCTLVVLAVLGSPLFHSAFREFRQRRVTVEALFVLTMAGALVASLQSFLAAEGPIYFETVSVLLVVYTVGKLIGARGRASALARSRAWITDLSRCRIVDEHGRHRDADVSEVLTGDVIEARPGETIAVDGAIERGTGFVCEAARTGEPFAAVRGPGDRVLAGSGCEDAVLLIRATAPGTSRQVDRFLEAVEEARSTPSSLQGQADRLARVFLPIVIAAALLTFAYWTWRDAWTVGLFNAMSVLLVACPCALGLATPVVLWSALGRLAERGLITREGDLVERLASVDRVVFDKTGTLSEERFALVELASDGTEEERHQLLAQLAAVEARSTHPVARAFADIVPRPEQERFRILSLRVLPGCGVEAQTEEGGELHVLRIGQAEWLGSPALLSSLRTVGQRIIIELDGRLVAVAVVRETLRESVTESLAALKQLGLPVAVMTGDTAEHASATLAGVMDSLPGCVSGTVAPEQKQALLRDMMEAGGKPLFVGDGINDAAALATATAGIALASGTDLAVGAAAATLHGGDLRTIPWAIALSRHAVAISRTTIFWAAGYNLIGMTLAALGILHPVAAALLMSVSSLCVAWLASRIGSVAVNCHPVKRKVRVSPNRTVSLVACLHAAGLALQGLLIVLLFAVGGPAAVTVTLGFLAAGIGLSLLWRRATAVPHAVDMLFGTLTIGSLGMMAGWWVDLGFGSAPDGCACGCGSPLEFPGMWTGMLVGCNLAMMLLGKAPCPASGAIALLLSNAGMTLGMLFGGMMAAEAVRLFAWPAGPTHLAAMTTGMALGMLAVHCLLGPRPDIALSYSR